MGLPNNLSIQDRQQALKEALGLVADGNRSAVKTVYDLTSAKLLGVILRIVRDREAAEDVLQDVFVKIWHRSGRFDPARASPIAWLCAIARNTAIDAIRKTGRRGEVSDDALPEVADGAPDAETMLCNAQDSALLHACLDRLQNDHRKSIRLAYFRGYSYSELASQLDVPLGTMKSWIRRGLASLKGCLGGG